jgi:hypothetical protein
MIDTVRPRFDTAERGRGSGLQRAGPRLERAGSGLEGRAGRLGGVRSVGRRSARVRSVGPTSSATSVSAAPAAAASGAARRSRMATQQRQQVWLIGPRSGRRHLHTPWDDTSSTTVLRLPARRPSCATIARARPSPRIPRDLGVVVGINRAQSRVWATTTPRSRGSSRCGTAPRTRPRRPRRRSGSRRRGASGSDRDVARGQRVPGQARPSAPSSSAGRARCARSAAASGRRPARV